MSALTKVKKPTLVVFEDICRRNIRAMTSKPKASGVNFRPHFKTHQSLTVGRWYRDEGVESITVSSVAMAVYFANDGWKDITIAFPFNSNEADIVNELAAKIKLNIIVSSVKSAAFASYLIKQPAGVFIEIDAGYPRSGIKAEDQESVENCLELIRKNPNLNFLGFLSHFGNTYSAGNKEEIKNIWKNSLEKLISLKQKYPGNIISVGDTPSCSIIENFSGVDEIRPGNFAFYDLMQRHIGSCSPDKVAVAVLCPVAAVYENENKAVLYCGAVHLSKDSIIVNKKQVFGQIGLINKKGTPEYIQGCYITSLSQEHAVVNIPDTHKSYFTEGMTVAVMPVHSCLTVACMKSGYIIPGFNPLEIMNGF